MDIYVALRDEPRATSFVVGAFSTEERAQTACQEDADSDAGVSGTPAFVLAWSDAEASLPDGSKYAVVLVDLDTPV